MTCSWDFHKCGNFRSDVDSNKKSAWISLNLHAIGFSHEEYFWNLFPFSKLFWKSRVYKFNWISSPPLVKPCYIFPFDREAHENLPKRTLAFIHTKLHYLFLARCKNSTWDWNKNVLIKSWWIYRNLVLFFHLCWSSIL